jgi:hypothetical protein
MAYQMGDKPNFTGGVVEMVLAYIAQLAGQLGGVVSGLTALLGGIV